MHVQRQRVEFRAQMRGDGCGVGGDLVGIGVRIGDQGKQDLNLHVALPGNGRSRKHVSTEAKARRRICLQTGPLDLVVYLTIGVFAPFDFGQAEL